MESENKVPKSNGASARGGGSDWIELHRRLKASQSALEQKLNPSTLERQRILRRRAQLLAEGATSHALAPETPLEIVEFILATEHYGIEVEYISEVHPLHELTPVPCTPKFVLGLANVRGRILSIIDIKRLFDLPEKGLTDLNKVICVRANQMELGLLADAIVGVRRLDSDELVLSLPTLTGLRAEYLKGVTKESLVVLDVQKMLSDENVIVDRNKSEK